MRPDTDANPEPAAGQDEIPFRLALLRAPGVGAVRFAGLLENFGSARSLFDAGPGAWTAAGLTAETCAYLRNPDWKSVDTDLAWLSGPANHLLACDESGYPALLKEIADPPALLFVHGDPVLLNEPQLAIVGSRNPTAGGKSLATDFAAHMTRSGLTISSGLASGIDAAAHRGALDAGGTTIAVTGTGLDRVYPAEHRKLAHRVAESGALVSEFPPGTPPLAANFPRRNRIISGLALGTLVVEAALRSGSLITARMALEQGREVFAIPGSTHNPLARGCHALIRQGAKLVETGDHILEELAPLIRLSLAQQETENRPAHNGSHPESAKLSGDYTQLLDCMGFDPVSVDQLVTRCGLTPEQVCSMLLILELEDYVVSGAGGRYTRSR